MPISKVPGNPTGNAHKLIDWCRGIRRSILERTPLAGPGIRLKQELEGIRIIAVEQPTTKSEPSSNVKRYEIVNRKGDYLECKIPGSDTPEDVSELIKVAKPYPLRVSSWNNGVINSLRYEEEATTSGDSRNGTYTEEEELGYTIEVIDPAYELDTEIYALSVPLGIQVRLQSDDEDDPDTADVDESKVMSDGLVYWVDLNSAARRWVFGRVATRICQDVDGNIINIAVLIDAGKLNPPA